MSRNEWEKGTLLLPSAEARVVRNAVRAEADRLGERLYAEAQRFWTDLPSAVKRNANRYMDAVTNAEVSEELEALLWSCSYPAPRRAKRTDVVALLGKTTGANPTILCGEARISFMGRRVEWSVSENNHAVERAHEHPVARAFFKALSQVRWTRGTGGSFTGNDEYNRDARDEGAGANYVTASYGPIGPGAGF